jgi:Xaa-Pro aminopeptidase
VLDASYKAAFAALHSGTRETDVLAAALCGMLDAGGDIPAIVPPTASGPRTLSGTHGAATDRVVQENELFCIEIGGCYRRYHAVGVQSKWLGVPPRRIAQKYKELSEALEAGVSATLPGVRTADVARKVNAVLAQHDMALPGNHVGYGTGVGYPPTWLDSLRIKEGDKHVLEPNMVLFLFVYHTTAGLDGQPITLFIGEPILVTANGNDQLSQVPINLELG